MRHHSASESQRDFSINSNYRNRYTISYIIHKLLTVLQSEMIDMIAKEDPIISEEEAAQYDRQIRLWGLDAQKR